MGTEDWVRLHARNLDRETIAALNHEMLHQQKPQNDVERTLLAVKKRSIGIDDPQVADPVLLNDLDDWMSLHRQMTKGALPPLRPSDLNAAFADRAKALLEAVGATQVTVRIDLPQFAMDHGTPRVDVRGPGIAPLVQMTPTGTALLNKPGENPDMPEAVALMARARRPVVQPSLRGEDPGGIPRTLAELGITARMLSPLFIDDNLVGWISVYVHDRSRAWSEGDVEALERSAEQVQTMIATALHSWYASIE